MAPLPRPLPESEILKSEPRYIQAYAKCLNLEDTLQQKLDGENKENQKDLEKRLIYIRILGYHLHFVPTFTGLENVVIEILKCEDDPVRLEELGQMYFNHYIRPFRKKEGEIRTPSSYPSRPEFDTVVDKQIQVLQSTDLSHHSAKEKALTRDGYRCVVSGAYDWASVLKINELGDLFSSNTGAVPNITECAHIFSEFTNKDIEDNFAERHYAAAMSAIMCQFGYPDLPAELDGPKVHRLENVMTMTPLWHELFDTLHLWFVETDIPNKYKVETGTQMRTPICPEFVTFTTPDPVNLPVPCKTYLAIHAACAKVAHLSGAAEYIDNFERDMEEGTTLDPNGESAYILEDAIQGLQIAGY